MLNFLKTKKYFLGKFLLFTVFVFAGIVFFSSFFVSAQTTINLGSFPVDSKGSFLYTDYRIEPNGPIVLPNAATFINLDQLASDNHLSSLVGDTLILTTEGNKICFFSTGEPDGASIYTCNENTETQISGMLGAFDANTIENIGAIDPLPGAIVAAGLSPASNAAYDYPSTGGSSYPSTGYASTAGGPPDFSILTWSPLNAVVPAGAHYLAVTVMDSSYADNSDPSGTLKINIQILIPSPTVTLTANPTSVAYNASSTLTWTSTNATSCTASGDWSGIKSASGSEVKNNLTSNKNYVITCTGAGGTVSASAAVDVGAPSSNVCDAGVNLIKNGSFESPIITTQKKWDIIPWTNPDLKWQSNITGYGLEIQAGYTEDASPWVAYDGNQYAEIDAKDILVFQNIETKPGYTYSISFASSPRPHQNTTANNLDVQWGGSTIANIITDGSANTNTVWTAHQYTVVATTTSTAFAFVDQGTILGGGTFMDGVNVHCVSAPPPATPTVTLTANPTSVAYNGSSTLTWTSTNATSCVASGDWSGTKSISGSEVENNLTSNKNYIITCTGAGGTASSTATVTVGDILVPPVTPTGLSVSPSTCGNNWLNISWNTVSGATSYQVYRDGGATAVYNGTSLGFSDTGLTLGSSHSYTVRATNATGSSALSVSVSNTVSSACVVPPATLHIIKTVINSNGGTAIASAFNLHVKLSGTDVSGSPATGTGSPGTSYSLSAGTYVVSEDANTSYTGTFSGDCDASGNVTLASGDSKTCTVTNTDVPPTTPPVTPPTPSCTTCGGGPLVPPVVIPPVIIPPIVPNLPNTGIGIGIGTMPSPLIHLTEVPNPATLSVLGGLVTYTHNVTNPGTISLSNVNVVDDKCSPAQYISGDTNTDGKLDPTETWIYTCRTKLVVTTTNTAVASGEANGSSVKDTALATVTIASPGFPKTGFSPFGENNPWNFAILIGDAIVVLMAFIIVFKKRHA